MGNFNHELRELRETGSATFRQPISKLRDALYATHGIEVGPTDQGAEKVLKIATQSTPGVEFCDYRFGHNHLPDQGGQYIQAPKLVQILERRGVADELRQGASP
jgi:hypothetical protein